MKAELVYALANQATNEQQVLDTLKGLLFDPGEFRGVGNACVTALGRMATREALEVVRSLLEATNERTVLERVFAILKINDKHEDEL